MEAFESSKSVIQSLLQLYLQGTDNTKEQQLLVRGPTHGYREAPLRTLCPFTLYLCLCARDARDLARALQTWFAWAVSIVNSRALTIRGEKYLVPFADMFNYSPHKVSERSAVEY